MSYPCIEALIEFQMERWRFRLWIAREDLEPMGDDHTEDILILLRTYLSGVGEEPTEEALADFLAQSVPKLAAVQVTDLDRPGPRRGIVIYKEWP